MEILTIIFIVGALIIGVIAGFIIAPYGTVTVSLVTP